MSDHKTASFDEFKAYTIAVARGEKPVDPAQPKIWVAPADGKSGSSKDAAGESPHPRKRDR